MSTYGLEYSSGGGFGGGYGSFDAMGGYGNDDGGGAGGFMEEAGVKSTEKKGNRDRQTLTPVSVKQLSIAAKVIDRDAFYLDGVELTNAKLIGQMRNIAEHSTNTTFYLHDGTGEFKCQQYLDKADGVAAPHFKENSYVRVVGHLKEFNGELAFLVHNIQPVTDWNEITHHLLDTIFVHLQKTRGPVPGSENKVPNASSNSWNSSPGRLSVGGNSQWGNPNTGGNQFGSPYANTVAAPVKADPNAKLREHIANIVRQHSMTDQDGTGIQVEGISLALQRQGQPADRLTVKRICEEYQNNGIFYVGVSDDHYACT